MKRVFAIVFLAVSCGALVGPGTRAAETEAAPPPARTEETNAQDTLRSYLQVQEQLHATQLAIERYRKEAGESAAQNAKALADTAKVLTDRLQAMEQSLGSQRVRELEVIQNSNRVVLIVAAVFGAIGLLAMLLMAYFQWQALARLANIASGAPAVRKLGPPPVVAALGLGDGPLVSAGPAEESNVRLLGALDKLEKRIYELEHTLRRPLSGLAAPADGASGSANGNGDTGHRPAAEPSGAAALLKKGQDLLDGDQSEEALDCFERALTLDSQNAEALVKKGTALERLRRLDEAIRCYDLAIAADNSFTVAYLHKGGLFNRMEKFSEALECYEQALRTQERRGV